MVILEEGILAVTMYTGLEVADDGTTVVVFTDVDDPDRIVKMPLTEQLRPYFADGSLPVFGCVYNEATGELAVIAEIVTND